MLCVDQRQAGRAQVGFHLLHYVEPCSGIQQAEFLPSKESVGLACRQPTLARLLKATLAC